MDRQYLKRISIHERAGKLVWQVSAEKDLPLLLVRQCLLDRSVLSLKGADGLTHLDS